MGGVVDPPTPIPIDNTTVPLPLLGPFPRFLILGEKFRDLGHAPLANGCRTTISLTSPNLYAYIINTACRINKIAPLSFAKS